jgi:hypothetical protein
LIVVYVFSDAAGNESQKIFKGSYILSVSASPPTTNPLSNGSIFPTKQNGEKLPKADNTALQTRRGISENLRAILNSLNSDQLCELVRLVSCVN